MPASAPQERQSRFATLRATHTYVSRIAHQLEQNIVPLPKASQPLTPDGKPCQETSDGALRQQHRAKTEADREHAPAKADDPSQRSWRAQEEARAANEAALHLEQEATTLRTQNKLHLAELVSLSLLLERQEQRAEELREHFAWVVAVHKCLQNPPRWWHALITGRRCKWQRQRLKRAGLFDYDAYLMRYPDVAAAEMDALDHYLHFGHDEGRWRSSNDQEWQSGG